MFNDFVQKYNLKHEGTSNLKIQQYLCSIGLDNIGISSRDGPFSKDKGVVNFHPSRGTRWVC